MARDIDAEVKKLLSAPGYADGPVSDDNLLVDIVGEDSLAVVEMLMHMENEFDISIPEEKEDAVYAEEAKLKDLVKLIYELRGETPPVAPKAEVTPKKKPTLSKSSVANVKNPKAKKALHSLKPTFSAHVPGSRKVTRHAGFVLKLTL